jgi:hypothetical protein
MLSVENDGVVGLAFHCLSGGKQDPDVRAVVEVEQRALIARREKRGHQPVLR